MANNIAVHHLHKRKRIHEKHEVYPHPDKWKNRLDKIIYFIAIIGPLMFLPQIIKIWMEQDAQNISLITWSTYLIFGFLWLLYGIVHKEKPIIFANILWIILDAIIIFEKIVF